MRTGIAGWMAAAAYIREVVSGEYIIDAYGNAISVEGKTDGGTAAIFSDFNADTSGQKVVLEADGRFLGVVNGGDVKLTKVAGNFSKLAKKPVRIEDSKESFYFELKKIGGPGNKHTIEQNGKYMVSEGMKLKMKKYKKKDGKREDRDGNSVFEFRSTRGDAERELGGGERDPARRFTGSGGVAEAGRPRNMEEQNMEKVLSEVLKVVKEKMDNGAKKRTRSRESESADAEESNLDEDSFSEDVSRMRAPSPRYQQPFRTPLGQRNAGNVQALPQQNGYYGVGNEKRRRRGRGSRKRRNIEEYYDGDDQGVSSVQQIVPGAQQMMSGAQQVVPGAQQTMSGAQQTMPGTQQMVPATQQMTPSTQQMAPATQQTMPGTQQMVPATQQMTPSTQQMAPSTQQMAPATQQMAPATQQMAPVPPTNTQGQDKGVVARGMENKAFESFIEEIVENKIRKSKKKKRGSRKEDKENNGSGSGGSPLGGMAKKLLDRTPIGIASSIFGGG